MSRLSEAAAAIATRLAYWKCDETSGTTIDDSESTNDLTLTGATLDQASLVPSNPNGGSISFDGTDDYLRVALPAAYKVATDLSFMVAFRVPTTWPSTKILFALQPRGAGSSGHGVDLLFMSGGKLRLRKGTSGGFITQDNDSTLSVDENYLLFGQVGTSGITFWIEQLVGGPASTTVDSDGSSGNSTAIDWSDLGAGAYPDPAQMYVGAFRSNAAAADNVVANALFASVRVSDLTLFDGALSNADRSTLFAAACFAAPPGAFIAPAAGTYDIASPQTVSWGAAAGESGYATTYHLQYERNDTDTWTNAVASQTGTSYSFTAPSVGSYRFRVRALVNSVPSEWVEIDDPVQFKRVTAGTAFTHEDVVLSHSPEEFWHLEETASEADFLKVTGLTAGYDATGGDVDASSSAADFESRDEDGICNAVQTKGGSLEANFLATKRPANTGLFANDFATAVWAWPTGNSATLGGPHLMLVRPAHAGEPQITGMWALLGVDLGNAFVEENGMYGLGLSIERGRIAAHLYSHNFAPTKVTWFDPTSSLSLDWHHVACVVDVRDVAGSDKIRIRLFLDGTYCDDLSGSYTELDIRYGALGHTVSGHSGAERLSWIGSWPQYGIDFDVTATDRFGNRYQGYFDEPSWYAYTPDDDIWMQQYLAGLATINATPAGAVTSPLAGESRTPGSVVAVAWGAAVGATGYLVERQIDGGAYVVRATPSTTSYNDTLPATEHEQVRYRITPLFQGYAPEACANASVVSGIFSIETTEDVAALCTLRLDVFDDDGETILWSVATDPAHANPYLEEPTHYGEQEIDVVAGAATIAQVEVSVIDRRQIAGDQDSGWLTERLADVFGHRNRLRRYTSEGWVTIADGPAATPRLIEYAGYTWAIRDTRESERKVRAFVAADTSCIVPRGITSQFGGITPVAALTVELQGFPLQRWLSYEAYWDGGWPGTGEVDPAIVIAAATEPLLEPTAVEYDADLDISRFTYGNITIAFRDAGSSDPFTYVRGPVVEYSGVGPSGVDVDGNSLTAFLLVKDGEVDGVAVRAALQTNLLDVAGTPGYWANFMFSDPTGTEYEAYILARAPTSDATPYHVGGITAGTFLQNLYDGVYSPRDVVTGDIVPTGIRYDAAALAQMTDIVTLRLTKAVDDARDWAEKYIYAPTGWIPALDSDGRISPVSQVPPEDTDGLVDIHNGVTEPADAWHAGERVVNVVKGKYPRYYQHADSTAADGLLSREVTHEFRDEASILRHSERVIEYDLLAFSATGDETGQATGVEVAAELIDDRQRYMLARFRLGAQAIDVNVRRNATATTRVGDWVTIDLSWFPDYQTLRRGLMTSGQVIAIGELDCAWRRFLIEEATPVPVDVS